MSNNILKRRSPEQNKHRFENQAPIPGEGNYDNLKLNRDPLNATEERIPMLAEGEKKEEILNLDRTQNNNKSHLDLLLDPEIWSKFPIGERTLFRIKSFSCKKGTTKKTYVDVLNNTNKHPGELEAAYLDGKVVRLTIMETSNLVLDPNVLHPFVLVHILDIEKGTYIPKVANSPAVCQFESITQYMRDTKEFSRAHCDILIPVATNCVDLREMGTARPRWNEIIYFDVEASVLMRPNILFLFEILDFNTQLISEGKFNLLDSNLYYRIAWSYLRPIGLAKNHIGMSKLQLYKYKFEDWKTSGLPMNPMIPHVYYDFLWPYKTEYSGYLSTQFLLLERPPKREVKKCPMTIFEYEKGEKEKFSTRELKKLESEEVPQDKDYIDRMNALFKRKRLFEDEESHPPEKILFKFQTASQGCLRLNFSHNGRFLAAACTFENSRTCIKIFNVEDGELSYTFRGHMNIIHDLCWSRNDRFLLACSSDSNASVWKLPNSLNEDVDEDDSERMCLLTYLKHPSYVYGSKFHPEKTRAPRLIVATACFDSKVRIWLVTFDDKEKYLRHELISEVIINTGEANYDHFSNLLDHRHPNCLQFDDAGRLYVGDSLGVIHIYDIPPNISKKSIVKIRIVTDKEIEGDPINCINLVPPELSKMLVHSRDNCIRSIDNSNASQRIVDRYFGSKSTVAPIRSQVSPDGQYVISGSEDGKIYIWNSISAEPVQTTNLEISLNGPVSDVDWCESYHLVAVSGFGKEYPILIYCWERVENYGSQEYQLIIEKLKRRDQDNQRGGNMDQLYEGYNEMDSRQGNFGDTFNDRFSMGGTANSFNIHNTEDSLKGSVKYQMQKKKIDLFRY